MQNSKNNNSENNSLSKEEIKRLERQEKFIKSFIEKWGSENFDFSKVYYVDQFTPVTIFCKVHGELSTSPYWFLRKGCNECTKEKNLELKKETRRLKEQDKFIQKFQEKWDKNQYDLSQVYYVNSSTPVTVICKDHGPQTKLPHVFLDCPCYECYLEGERLKRQNDFIQKCINKFGDKQFDYSQVYFVSMESPQVTIICKDHGPLTITPKSFLLRGCNQCNKEKERLQRQENFIKKCIEKFGDQFDYSQVYYTSMDSPVVIICPEHGSQNVTPDQFLRRSSYGCPECGKAAAYQTKINKNSEKVMEAIKEKYKDTLDFSNSVYKGIDINIEYICKYHGVQHSQPSNLLKGVYGCPQCAWEALKLTKEEFIQKAKEIHKDKYRYDMVNYINSTIPVQIYCNECQEYFWQTPSAHIYNKQGHEKCCGHHIRTKEEFLKECEERYSSVFDFSFVQYKDMSTPVEIVCKTCGNHFWRLPADLLGKKNWGCPYCNKKHVWTTEEFVQILKDYFGSAYDFSEVEYVNNKTPIKIICPEHGPFYKTPGNIWIIINSGREILCPYCRISEGENRIYKDLLKIGFMDEYITRQKFYEDLYIFSPIKNRKYFLKFDFYLPQYNLCIEYQGEQHYIPVEYWGGEEELKKNQEYDLLKKNYCKDNKISLLEIKYDIPLEQIESSLKALLIEKEKEWLEKPKRLFLTKEGYIEELY